MARLTTRRQHTRLPLTILLVCLSLTPVSVSAQGVRVAKVVQVVDGSSLIAEVRGGTKLRVRLLGIEAPQLAQGKKPAQPHAQEARDYLDQQIGGRAVRVQVYGQDASGRTLGVIWNGRVNVNVLMVMLGYAEVDRREPCQYYCAELLEGEAWARQKKMGVWSEPRAQ